MPNGRTRYLLRRLRASEIDLDVTVGLINRAFARHEILVAERTSTDGLLAEAGPDAEFLQVADGEGRLLASVIARAPMPEDGEAIASTEGALFLSLAAVEDGHTRAGLGKLMLREAERLARARGYTSIVIGAVREFDLVPYWESRGFSVIRTQAYEADHWSIQLLHHYCEMQRALTPAFRLAHPAETARVTEIVNAAYRVEDFFIDGNRTTEEEIARLIAAGEILVLVAADGAIGGAVHLELRGSHGYFGMLSIDPGRQSFGWGRMLIDTAEQRAIDAGCIEMDLQVVNLREVLPEWYRKIGYSVNGTCPFPDPWKLRTAAHMVTMNKPLPGGSEGKEIWL